MCDNIIVIYCNASHKIGQLVFLSLLTATISYVCRPAIETKGTTGYRLSLVCYIRTVLKSKAQALASDAKGSFQTQVFNICKANGKLSVSNIDLTLDRTYSLIIETGVSPEDSKRQQPESCYLFDIFEVQCDSSLPAITQI